MGQHGGRCFIGARQMKQLRRAMTLLSDQIAWIPAGTRPIYCECSWRQFGVRVGRWVTLTCGVKAPNFARHRTASHRNDIIFHHSGWANVLMIINVIA